MERNVKSKTDQPSTKPVKVKTAKPSSASSKLKPVRYFKGRPVYSQEQTAQMDCPFPEI